MRVTYVFLLVSLLSCQQDRVVPKAILQPAKMEQVFLDMMRADEYANQQSIADTTALQKQSRTNLYQKVLQIHKVTKDDFQMSLKYYQNNPDKLKIVLDSMFNEAKRTSGGAMPDSLKRIRAY
jgi:hypothetical protein